MTETPSPISKASNGSPVAKVFGYLLVTLGGLWTVLAGGCTLVFIGNDLGSSEGQGLWGGGGSGVGLALILGAFCIAPGGLMLWAGTAILRGERRRQAGG